jgi:hypothetical protein
MQNGTYNNSNTYNLDDDDDDDEGQWKRKMIDNKYTDNDSNSNNDNYTIDNVNRGLWKGEKALNFDNNRNSNSNSKKFENLSNVVTIEIGNNYDNHNSNNNRTGLRRRVLRLLGNSRKGISNILFGNSNDKISNDNNNEPKGIVNIVGRSARRRLLNLFDRQTNWNKGNIIIIIIIIKSSLYHYHYLYHHHSSIE